MGNSIGNYKIYSFDLESVFGEKKIAGLAFLSPFFNRLVAGFMITKPGGSKILTMACFELEQFVVEHFIIF